MDKIKEEKIRKAIDFRIKEFADNLEKKIYKRVK